MTSSQQRLFSVVVDEKLGKTKQRHEREGYGSENNITKPHHGAAKVLQPAFAFQKCSRQSSRNYGRNLDSPIGQKALFLANSCFGHVRRGVAVPCLFFSQMMGMLHIVLDKCSMRGFSCQRLDGSMPNDLRVRAVDHYNAPESTVQLGFNIVTRAIPRE